MATRDIIQAAAGVGGGGSQLYVEDVFSTYLYTGNSSTRTITNGIDLAGEGGLVWVKSRSAIRNHHLVDTERGASTGGSPGKTLFTNSSSAASVNNDITGFNSNGFNLGTSDPVNNLNETFTSWTFRKAPKFFDVVTWTGGGGATRTISHNLGSTPGVIIIKKSSGTQNWVFYHKDLGLNLLSLNSINGAGSDWYGVINSVGDTSFTVTSDLNTNSSQYVAYLFAHNAGGFGKDGTESVISCGKYIANGPQTINLGWEPQWLLVRKATDMTTDVDRDSWHITDNIRGMNAFDGSGATSAVELKANYTNVETSLGDLKITSTGFASDSANWNNGDGSTYVYIAIRRGPMKVPTSSTEVFASGRLYDSNASANGVQYYSGFPVDLLLWGTNPAVSPIPYWRSRIADNRLRSDDTSAENTQGGNYWQSNIGISPATGTAALHIAHMLRRAPGFFDVVAYTGTGAVQNVAHNLGVAPELLIVKSRSLNGQEWPVQVLGDGTKILKLNSTSAFITSSAYWNDTGATESVFTVTGSGLTGSSGATYIAYLFATLAGVSKVGTYTGTGTTQQIDCGFSGGARFVLIKRTDSTGDWYMWDSVRGIVAGNDPYILLNSTAVEVTNTDYIDPYSAGFEISSAAIAAINASGGTYLYLAIS